MIHLVINKGNLSEKSPGLDHKPPRPLPHRVHVPILHSGSICRTQSGSNDSLQHSPGVKLVYDALEADDSEEPGAEAGQPGQEENGERQEGLPPGGLCQAARKTPCSSDGAARFSHRRGGGTAAGASIPGVGRGPEAGGGRFVFAVRNGVMYLRILAHKT